MRRLFALPGLWVSLALGACAAPAPEAAHAAPPATTAPAKPAPAASAPAAVALDRTCKSDSDCTVKNVGNCCGQLPACVNVNSPTDPEGVQAACARSGRMSVCGFKPIEGCQCVKGECKDKIAEVEMVH